MRTEPHYKCAGSFPGFSLDGFGHVQVTVQSNSLFAMCLSQVRFIVQVNISHSRKDYRTKMRNFDIILSQNDFDGTDLDTDKGRNENSICKARKIRRFRHCTVTKISLIESCVNTMCCRSLSQIRHGTMFLSKVSCFNLIKMSERIKICIKEQMRNEIYDRRPGKIYAHNGKPCPDSCLFTLACVARLVTVFVGKKKGDQTLDIP